MLRGQFEIQTSTHGILVDNVICRQLVDVEKRIGGRARQNECTRRMEGINDLSNSGNSLRFGESARSGFDQIDSVSQTIPLITAEEKYLVLHDRTAGGTAELVHSKWKPGFSAGSDAIKEVPRIQFIVSQKLKCRSVKRIAAGLCYYADLSAGSGSEFGRVVIGFNTKLLDILEAALKFEWRNQLSADNSRFGVNDSGSFDTVVSDRVLVGCASIETDISVLTVSRVLCARRLQIQLRELTSVNRKFRHFSSVHIRAQAGRIRFDTNFGSVCGNGKFLRYACRLHDQIQG